ncbi:hypothetical protein HY492_02955 [Candidatus Woesearchaeota archaeon]|nr:hypothetical protein [Candidatus Woesearchaeota archaeon]
MKVKLNYERTLPACITQERFKHCLEHLLEVHGAIIDRRERLIAQNVIYATLKEQHYASLAQCAQRYGLQLERQGAYRGT